MAPERTPPRLTLSRERALPRLVLSRSIAGRPSLVLQSSMYSRTTTSVVLATGFGPKSAFPLPPCCSLAFALLLAERGSLSRSLCLSNIDQLRFSSPIRPQTHRVRPQVSSSGPRTGPRSIHGTQVRTESARGEDGNWNSVGSKWGTQNSAPLATGLRQEGPNTVAQRRAGGEEERAEKTRHTPSILIY
jgi:hypothetical protein